MDKDIINWSGVSESLTGHTTYIRRDKILKKHKEAVKELTDFIEYWKHKHSNNPKKE